MGVRLLRSPFNGLTPDPLPLQYKGVRVPSWISRSVFYQIFPDRFFHAPNNELGARFEPWDAPPTLRGFKGGNLKGIEHRIDHLKELGITALYLTPVFHSTANHRYHTSDYFRIDPVLGTHADFRSLVDTLHAAGIRLILDGVFNHVGRGFWAFQNVVENGELSPFRDWFHIHEFPIFPYDDGKPARYSAWWDIRELPKLNNDLRAVQEYLFSVAEYWIEQGIDGWRLDVPNEIASAAFWEEFRHRVKSKNSEAYLVGEIWHEATEWLQGDRFDAVMNYPVTKILIDRLIDPSGPWHGESLSGYGAPIRSISSLECIERLTRLAALYPEPIRHAQYNLLSSHDTVRIRTLFGGDARRMRLAYALLFFFPGVPSIYYGDEVGMIGGRDPDSRRGMVWNRTEWDMPIYQSIKELIELRRSEPALQSGELHLAVFDAEGIEIRRTLGGNEIALLANPSDRTQVFCTERERIEVPSLAYRLLRKPFRT